MEIGPYHKDSSILALCSACTPSSFEVPTQLPKFGASQGGLKGGVVVGAPSKVSNLRPLWLLCAVFLFRNIHSSYFWMACISSSVIAAMNV